MSDTKSSVFSAESFLQTETTQATETKFTPVPEGDYQAIVSDVASDISPNKGAPFMKIEYEILNEELKTRLNMKRIIVKQTIWLDINETGGLAVGPNKNVKLGKLREALGQNKSGQPWSPRMLSGAGPVLIHVTERPNDNDPEIIYNDVSRVSRV